MVGMRDTVSLAEFKSNVVGLARIAKALDIPTLHHLFQRAMAERRHAAGDQGDLPRPADLPAHRHHQLLRGPVLPQRFRGHRGDDGPPPHHHRGRDDRHLLRVADAVDAERRLPVFPVVDACGGWSRYEAEAAMSRMATPGAELVTTFALACELQADWKLPSATAMLEPVHPEPAGVRLRDPQLLEQCQPARPCPTRSAW